MSKKSDPPTPGASAATSSQLRSNFSVKPPEPVKLGKDVNAQPPEIKKFVLISTMGMEALQKYNSTDPEDTDTADEILQKLDRCIMGEPNETFERYKFNTRIQGQNESIGDYVADLKSLIKTCNYCDCLRDTLLRDRIVLGVNSEKTRTRLLQERTLTLDNCLDICKSFEMSTTQLKVISGSAAVNKVHNSTKQGVPRDQTHSSRPNSNKNARPKLVKCKFCAQEHPPKKELCPAWGKECNKCKRLNHFSKCCPDAKTKVHGVVN